MLIWSAYVPFSYSLCISQKIRVEKGGGNTLKDTSSVWWISKENASFILHFECMQLFDSVLIRNIYKKKQLDSSTKSFTIYFKNMLDGRWENFINGTLENTINAVQDVVEVPIEKFQTNSRAFTNSIKFEVNSFYGSGGGIAYLQLLSCRQIEHFDFYAETTLWKTFTDSFLACSKECKNTVTCAYFSWNKATQICKLKNEIEYVKLSKDIISGTSCFGGKSFQTAFCHTDMRTCHTGPNPTWLTKARPGLAS